MRITTPDGRVLGHVTLTADDMATVADTLEARTRRLIDDTRRAAIATAGGWTPGPRPTTETPDRDRPRRRRPWWLYVVGVLVVLGVFGAMVDDDDDTPPSTPAAVQTIAPQPINAPRAMPGPDGSIVVGSVAVDNVYREGSPLRERFAAIMVDHNVTGTKGRELDANVSAGVSYCHALARGELAAVREADAVSGTAADGVEIGTQRRAIVVGALSALCPAL
ncbi:membrane protein [Gordonia Phage Lollipop1437]|uniref:DUF732 domain-containing protein n=1 Tax=Gordonia Phage Lollipop1437 TaxID=2588505 RepID=A0A4Y6ETI2_9CAUD|nr:membrane protein [Gordonia Phage Lollipop1437]QDF19189.1 hypothetical protein SEA_LOLLIPOP1437_85 [Gordonia Phage Lollipop1437]